MINETFYMLSPEDKKEVIDNIDTYSLDDIEAKLSVLCMRKQISFGKSDPEEQPAPHFHLGSMSDEEDEVPAWIKAVIAKQKNM